MKELLQSLTAGDRDWQLANELDPTRIPAHIAIIMDGNGRWAKQRNFPRIWGHKAGMDTVSRIVETSTQLGLQALTLYAFSVENWKRPRHEVEGLWRLLRYYLRREMPRLMQNDIRLVAIGRLEALPPEVQRELLAGMEKTAKNRRMRLNLAINYGGRTEIVDAVNSLLQEARRKGDLSSLEITEAMVSSRLYTAGMSDPDLLIRTSGEMRISNFLLWQIAYSELYVTETLWPDFDRTELLEAVLAYQNRERRFGGLSAHALPSVDSASFPLEEEALELPLA
jgi:undecaprenyl diphosphate synthase